MVVVPLETRQRSGATYLQISNPTWRKLGTSLDQLIKLTFFVKGPFPTGGVLSSPNFRQDVMDEFFAQHCPRKHCSYNNPLRWSRLSEQFFRVDKWSVCRG